MLSLHLKLQLYLKPNLQPNLHPSLIVTFHKRRNKKGNSTQMNGLRRTLLQCNTSSQNRVMDHR